MKGYYECFNNLCSAITIPKVVTLHEIYHTFPGVFPRDAIRGFCGSKYLEEVIYDIRHPVQTTLRKHVKKHFHTDYIHVHYNFQRSILVSKGIAPNKIHVVGYPIRKDPLGDMKVKKVGNKVLHLGATGFISNQYDYEMLFAVLEKIDISWRFEWIGTIRRNEDRKIVDTIMRKVKERGWGNRFFITGWVTERQKDRLLKLLDVYCALYKSKSCSESLATAIGAGQRIVASHLPITVEIGQNGYPLELVQDNPKETAERILTIAYDRKVKRTIQGQIRRYKEKYNVENVARKMVAFYRSII